MFALTRSLRWWAVLLAVGVLGGACADDEESPSDASVDSAMDVALLDATSDMDSEPMPDVESHADTPPDTESADSAEPQDSTDLAEAGNTADVAPSCLPGALDVDQDLRFSFTGNQNVRQISRNTSAGSLVCSTVSVSATLTNPVHLVRYLGTWYFWHEEPYNTLTFNSQGGVLLVSGTTSSPHAPFVSPADSNRKGIPLVVVVQDEQRLVLREAPEARQVVGLSERLPLCTPYRFGSSAGTGLDNFSGLSLTLARDTGALEVSHSCLVHRGVSGCPQPSLRDDITGTGALICPVDSSSPN